MLNRLFNHTNLLQKSLDATWLRQETISQNIANSDTPGYNAKRVEFESAFAEALASDGTGFVAKRTNGKHIDFTPESDPLSVTPRVVTDTHYTMRMDENNVDIDNEMVELAKNTIQYNTLVTKVSKELGRMKTLLRDIK